MAKRVICKKCGKKPIDSNRTIRGGQDRWCNGCRRKYHEDYYERHKEEMKQASSDNYYANRDRAIAYSRKFRRDNPRSISRSRSRYYQKNKSSILEKIRNHRYKRVFGISSDEYQAMHDKQKGLCASCSRPETARTRSGRTRRLSVDHSHETGRVRELLCSRCNTIAGLANESTETLRMIIAYIRRHDRAIPAGSAGSA